MYTDKKQLDADVTELSLMQQMANVYGEVALARMAMVRAGVLQSRAYLQELTKVFAHVQSAYLNKLKQTATTVDKRKKLTVLSHNGLTVSVLISANTRLYGDLVRRTYDKFMEEFREGKAEATIIGKIGLSWFKEDMGKNQLYTYFDYPDEQMDQAALKEISKHLVQYEEIHVFYGEYKNVVVQEPRRLVMSASRPMSGQEENSPPQSYFFEPSLEAVMGYFEEEIFGTLLDQAMREAQLSKYASRLTAMDRADQEIDKFIVKLKRERLGLGHLEINRKMINSWPSLARALDL